MKHLSIKHCGLVSRFASLLGLVVLGVLIGCNQADFKTGPKAPAKIAPLPVERTFQLTCDTSTTESRIVESLTGPDKTTVSLRGEFCQLEQMQIKQDLNVAFAVDISGSMADNDPTGMFGFGTCGRLKAVEAIVTKMQEYEARGVNVKYSYFLFDDRVAIGGQRGPLTRTQLQADMRSDVFCQEVGGTNYQDVFNKANTYFTTQAGQKVMYFISDGEPSVYSGPSERAPYLEARNAGLAAANALRAAFRDLQLYAIFLGSSTGGSSGFNAESYLQQVTGNPANVKMVNNAQDLAAEIIKFPTPQVGVIDRNSVQASLTASSFGPAKPITLASLTADPSRPGVWQYVTNPIALYGQEGQTITNEISLIATDSLGKTRRSTATINFTLNNTPLTSP